MAKKTKEIKYVAGKDVVTINGNRTWLTCITEKGEKFSIGFSLLFELLDDYNFKLEKYGDRFRTIDFYKKVDDGIETIELIHGN